MTCNLARTDLLVNPDRMPKTSQSDYFTGQKRTPKKWRELGIFKPAEPHCHWDACCICYFPLSFFSAFTGYMMCWLRGFDLLNIKLHCELHLPWISWLIWVMNSWRSAFERLLLTALHAVHTSKFKICTTFCAKVMTWFLSEHFWPWPWRLCDLDVWPFDLTLHRYLHMYLEK